MTISERRKSPRRRLAAAIEIVLSGPEGLAVRGRLEDASLHGLRLARAQVSEPARLPDARLRVTGCPGPLENLLLGRQCAVVWVEGATLGVEFTPPLSISIEGLAESLDFVSF